MDEDDLNKKMIVNFLNLTYNKDMNRKELAIYSNNRTKKIFKFFQI